MPRQLTTPGLVQQMTPGRQACDSVNGLSASCSPAPWVAELSPVLVGVSWPVGASTHPITDTLIPHATAAVYALTTPEAARHAPGQV
jgi:hypothetical protein